MILTFLGTGTSQGVPVIACDCEVCKSLDYRDERTRTSVHIQNESDSINIDCGPDFRTQVLRERVQKLDAILFTHEHRDHTAGLDDVRSFNFKQKTDMPVYASEQVINALKSSYDYVFAASKYPGVPRVETNEINGEPIVIGQTEFLPINVYHHKLPVFGFRIKDLVYITDANAIPESEFSKLIGVKTLIINALQKEKHISHFNVEEALAIVDRVQPEKTYFTHISHKLGLHRDVEEELPADVLLAYDGLKIEF